MFGGIWRRKVCLFMSGDDCYCREGYWKMVSNCLGLVVDVVEMFFSFRCFLNGFCLLELE